MSQVLLKNNYPDWMIKESKKKPATPIINQDTGLEVKKMSSLLSMFLASLRNLEESSYILVYMSSSKEPTPLNLSLCNLKIKFHNN